MPCSRKQWWRVGVVAVLAAVVTGTLAGGAFAQGAPGIFAAPGGAIPLSTDYKPMNIAGWLVSPALFGGATYDSNVFSTSQQRVSAGGFRLAPSAVANRDSGLFNTTLYANGDATFYGGSASGENLINGHVGASEVYAPQRDLTFNFQGDFSHQTNLFSNVVTNPVATSNVLPNNQSLLSPISTSTNNPSTQFSGVASVLKTLGRGFVGVGASVAHTSFRGLSSQDNTVTTVSGKAGYYLTPQLFAYVQPSVDWRDYATSSLNSHGYRIVGGLGSDQIGLFRGEVYAGYQAENYAGSPNSGGPVLGGRLSYLPTPYWTITAAVDETLDAATPTTLVVPTTTPAPTRTTSAVLQSTYALSPMWSITGSAGWVELVYINSPQIDHDWLFDARLAYSVWANMSLAFEYQYIALDSNVPLTSYNRNIVSAGLLYKF